MIDRRTDGRFSLSRILPRHWIPLIGLAVMGLSIGPSVRPSVSQEPVKVHLMGDPQPGTRAPGFSLPYFTAEGPGPVDQPFVLQAELGRVVVLAFCREVSDSAAVTLLRTLSDRQDSLFAGDVAVAAILPSKGTTVAGLAQDKALRIKLLPDSTSQVRRMFGVDGRKIGVYVIGQDGKVTWRDLQFNPFLAPSYDRLSQAVRDAARRR